MTKYLTPLPALPIQSRLVPSHPTFPVPSHPIRYGTDITIFSEASTFEEHSAPPSTLAVEKGKVQPHGAKKITWYKTNAYVKTQKVLFQFQRYRVSCSNIAPLESPVRQSSQHIMPKIALQGRVRTPGVARVSSYCNIPKTNPETGSDDPTPGSGQEVLEVLGRVESGRIRRFSSSHGSGRVTLTQPDLTREV